MYLRRFGSINNRYKRVVSKATLFRLTNLVKYAIMKYMNNLERTD